MDKISNCIISVETIKAIFVLLYTYYTNFKIINEKLQFSKDTIKNIILVSLVSIVCGVMKYNANYLVSLISAILMISIAFSKDNIKYSIITTVISMSINNIISFISVIIDFIILKVLNINNDYLNLLIMLMNHIFLISILFNIKKLKYGISFLKNGSKDQYIDIFVLDISAMILFSIIIFVNVNIVNTINVALGIVTLAVVMFITIQKSIQLSYKQKLLEQELKVTKEKLENKTKELEEAEKENIKISKKNHTITHKQKALSHKIEEIIEKIENSQEIGIDINETKRRIENLSKQINEEKVETELSQTDIPEIDDMLKYMQSESRKNNIDFELQIKGNINYMVNNLIDKEDLETLIADHVKNAIIAINHTDNINRSILVKLGKIEEIYSLYIYDSGIEFQKETLEMLGKKPSTTHSDEGGTGMGFMNTFDTLKKYKASLTIKQNGKPSKDNYTKAIIIKFDNKNEYTIK